MSSVASKNQLVVKLKTELDKTIALVVATREALEDEIFGSKTQRAEQGGPPKQLFADKIFISKLKELTASFNSLTESKIRLDKAEKAIEEDMTPAEERDAVMRYLADMDFNEMQVLFKEARILRRQDKGGTEGGGDDE